MVAPSVAVAGMCFRAPFPDGPRNIATVLACQDRDAEATGYTPQNPTEQHGPREPRCAAPATPQLPPTPEYKPGLKTNVRIMKYGMP
eukprot:8261128-Pyramimonas_sp.AAC.1